MGQKGFDFGLCHFSGVSFVMEENIAANPLNIGLLGAIGVVFYPKYVSNLFEQLFRFCGIPYHVAINPILVSWGDICTPKSLKTLNLFRL